VSKIFFKCCWRIICMIYLFCSWYSKSQWNEFPSFIRTWLPIYKPPPTPPTYTHRSELDYSTFSSKVFALKSGKIFRNIFFLIWWWHQIFLKWCRSSCFCHVRIWWHY
jgi:hypothetical protein